MGLLYAGLNHISPGEFFDGIVPDSGIDLSQVWGWISDRAAFLVEWLKQPHVLAILMAWWITFTVVLILLSCVGFNPVGIGAGTAAAAFQSWAYGGFTPAGGIFATLTSLGMLGLLMPMQVCLAAMMASTVAMIVWACG